MGRSESKQRFTESKRQRKQKEDVMGILAECDFAPTSAMDVHFAFLKSDQRRKCHRSRVLYLLSKLINIVFPKQRTTANRKQTGLIANCKQTEMKPNRKKTTIKDNRGALRVTDFNPNPILTLSLGLLF